MSRKRKFLSQLQAAEGAEEIRHLVIAFQGRSDDVLEMVAEHGRSWDLGLLLAVMASRKALLRLAENSALPPWALPHLVRWNTERLGGESAEERIWDASHSLQRLLRSGTIRLQEEKETKRALLECMEGDRESDLAHRRRLASLWVLLADPEMQASELESLARKWAAHLDAESIGAILLHAKCEEELRGWLVREVLIGMKKTVEYQLFEKLAEHAPLRLDPEMRAWFREEATRSVNTRILSLLVEDAQAEDCLTLFRWFSQGRLYEVARLLGGERGAAIATYLEEEDLLPLLNSPSQPVRLAAISAVGHLQGARVGEVEQSSPASSGPALIS